MFLSSGTPLRVPIMEHFRTPVMFGVTAFYCGKCTPTGINLMTAWVSTQKITVSSRRCSRSFAIITAGAEVIKFIETGRRLLRPPKAELEIFSIMTWCWEYEPAKRPSFKELSKFFTSNPEYANLTDLLGSQDMGRLICDIWKKGRWLAPMRTFMLSSPN